MPQLAAPVQLRNAATAIAALRALDADIDAAAFAHGVAGARLPGRLQAFDRAGVQVLVDVGHNPQAARALAQALQAQPVAGRTFAVYAALSDKDHAGVVAALADVVDAWHLAGSVDAGARGMQPDALAARLARSVARDAPRHANVGDALDAALHAAAPGDRVLVFGAFHAAETALRALGADAH